MYQFGLLVSLNMNYYKEIASALIYATLFEEFEVCIISTIYVVAELFVFLLNRQLLWSYILDIVISDPDS